MVLATIIRLEMAYPGVGILAGDSLQYLTVVTSHAVVMVFFMIMPLLFGAFANFLLPTQLGVHDVAFPRLNSAAFWFLPAGFIMLAQIVCIDRRYQRMNCFNIREIQTLLRSKYQPDSWDVLEYHSLLDSTAVGLRFKLLDLRSIDTSLFLTSDYGLSTVPAGRDQLYHFKLQNSTTNYTYYLFQVYFDKLLDWFVCLFYSLGLPSLGGSLSISYPSIGSSTGSAFNPNCFHLSVGGLLEFAQVKLLITPFLDSLSANFLTSYFYELSFMGESLIVFQNNILLFWEGSDVFSLSNIIGNSSSTSSNIISFD